MERPAGHPGDKVFDIIEAQPDRLQEVGGIGPLRAGRITAAWTEQKAFRESMVFLTATARYRPWTCA